MRPLGRLDQIALRADACRFALAVLGEGAGKPEMLGWIALYERVQLEGSAALEGVYGASHDGVVSLRVVGSAE